MTVREQKWEFKKSTLNSKTILVKKFTEIYYLSYLERDGLAFW